jgi:hypothetical protein
VNDAEYHGLLKGLALAQEQGIQDLIVVGDSRIVIQQVQGLINCNQPNLQRRLAECKVLDDKFKSLKLVHVKRDYNQAADYLTSKTLTLGEAWTVLDESECTHLQNVSKIHEKLMKSPVAVLDEKTSSADGVIEDVTHREVVPDESMPGPESAPLPHAARVFAVMTRAASLDTETPNESMDQLEYQAEQWRRIRLHQDQDDHPRA